MYTCPRSAPFDPTLFIRLDESTLNRLDSYPQAPLTIQLPLYFRRTHPQKWPLATPESCPWFGLVPHFNSRAISQPLSITGAGELQLSKVRKGGKGEDGWECWKTFLMYPRGSMACVVNTCEKKKQCCLGRQKMMIKNWGLVSHFSHVFMRETIFSIYKQAYCTQNHCERRLEK